METETLGAPAYGLDTVRWVLDAIKANPELHDQGSWEQVTDCGTAMCVAGWAAFAHRVVLDAKVKDILANPSCSCCDDDEEVVRVRVIPQIAREVMGLGSVDAGHLFYDTGNAQAVNALEILAAGGTVNWEELFND